LRTNGERDDQYSRINDASDMVLPLRAHCTARRISCIRGGTGRCRLSVEITSPE
jgi:hypothetical protein